MSTENPQAVKGTCFVVMGFGRKPDYQPDATIRYLDLDKTYKYIIKPAAEEAGLKCVRADELVRSGVIDLAMYEQLLSADVVIADLSTSNSNAFYELGVRHALRPYTTIIIAEDGLMQKGREKLPFDVDHVVVRTYHHLGEGLDFEEVMNFRKKLKEDIEVILARKPPESDSPVYTFLRGLNPPARTAEEAGRRMDKALGGAQAVAPPSRAETHSELIEKAEDAINRGDFETAKTVLGAIRIMRPDDPAITQRLVVATFKSEKPTPRQANEEAIELLKPLNPESSSDPWTLGLWGTVHERLWKETGDEAHLDQALRAYQRSFVVKRDYFNGIHEAFLRNVRAAKSDKPAEAITDFVLAERIRREVIPICEEWLKSTKEPSGEGDDKRALHEYMEEKSWVLATIAEAYMGTGDNSMAQKFFDQSEAVIRQLEEDNYPAYKIARMRKSTKQKREELQALLAASPLRHLR